MGDRHLVVIGGGLAGLSAGCYALQNGYRVTILEHNLALGGVCTAWSRDPYVVDGCIHWLTGGPFERVYEELEILPRVSLRTLETWVTYRDAKDGVEIPITRDLDALVAALRAISPEDADELGRLRRGATEVAALRPPLDAQELSGLSHALRGLWDLRHGAGAFVHFRKPIGEWAREHVASPRLRRIFTQLLPETAPALFLLLVLGYLERGYLTRPVGGTAAFRDQLEHTFNARGGHAWLHTTADEVLVRDGRACGVRLEDGTILGADAVISTASAPETVLRLLGGRFDGESTLLRLDRWKTFDPIVLASFGVATDLRGTSGLFTIDGIEPIVVGGRKSDRLSVRVCNDDPCFAPEGHTVIQAMVPTQYDWWASRSSRYNAEKDAAAAVVLGALEKHFPGITRAVRMTDIATPLTYWKTTRSWHGAYEGWLPSNESFFSHVNKKLSGLDGFYMAGQWVEPGGGVPTSLTSGRQAVQLLCADDGKTFRV
jgi:phytoene dehydrogenase-like protein